MRRFVTQVCLATAVCLTAYAAPLSESRSIVILELFTSEGCSSCPPADALLQRVNLQSTASSQRIIGISEHVTYWDRLGWRDPYSLETFTSRQSNYARRLAVDAPYTPQMVLNGRERSIGSDSVRFRKALQVEADRPRFDLQIEAAINPAGMIQVTLDTDARASRARDVMAVIVDDADRSNVLRGENGGRVLQHVAVARSLELIGMVTQTGRQHLQVHVPDSLRTSLHGGHHLIVFLQEAREGAILGAATVAL